MQFTQAFKNFDPINGELHKKTPPVINYYFKLAKDILVNRNHEEIEFAISTINYLLDGGRELLFNSEIDKEKETINIELDNSSIDEFVKQLMAENRHFTPSAMLYDVYCHFNIEINNQEDFKNANWAEYFAVLALAEIAEMQNSIVDSPHPTILISQAAEIGEAIAYARTFEEAEKSDSRLSHSVVSLSASTAAIARHEKSNEWKQQFFVWFDDEYLPGKKDPEINRSAAARRFYKTVIVPALKNDSTDPLQHRREDNIIRMLLDALRKHLATRTPH